MNHNAILVCIMASRAVLLTHCRSRSVKARFGRTRGYLLSLGSRSKGGQRSPASSNRRRSVRLSQGARSIDRNPLPTLRDRHYRGHLGSILGAGRPFRPRRLRLRRRERLYDSGCKAGRSPVPESVSNSEGRWILLRSGVGLGQAEAAGECIAIHPVDAVDHILPLYVIRWFETFESDVDMFRIPGLVKPDGRGHSFIVLSARVSRSSLRVQ